MSPRELPRADLGRRARAALTSDPRTSRYARGVEVQCAGDEVTLRGVVPLLRARGAAALVVGGLAGVGEVRNELLVATSERADDEVARILVDALTLESSVDERRIDVQVEDGVVRLRGEVETLTHSRLVTALAWWVRGVRGVVNELETRQETTPDLASDDEVLAAGVDVILDKDPLVDSGEVQVLARRGVVTLAGAVGGQTESDAAEEDAWATPGVRDVRNELAVTRGASSVMRRAS